MARLGVVRARAMRETPAARLLFLLIYCFSLTRHSRLPQKPRHRKEQGEYMYCYNMHAQVDIYE